MQEKLRRTEIEKDEKKYKKNIPIGPISKTVLWIRIHWFRIQIQHFSWIPISAFDDKNMKNYRWNFSYLIPSIKDVQVTGEAFIPQKRTSNTSKQKISFFSWAIFALLDPDPNSESEFTELVESRSNLDPQHYPKFASAIEIEKRDRKHRNRANQK